MSLVLFLLRNSYPPYVRGITHWASALAIFFVACVLFSKRGVWADFITIFIANLVMMFGMTLLYFGSRRHFDLLVAPRNWIIFGTVCLAVITLSP